jgi:hypothetical protein
MVTSGSGTVESATVSGNDVIVNLTGVANAQTLAVTLFGVNTGQNVSDIAIPMSVLLGDVNGSGTVSTSDIGQTKAQAGTTSGTTFRSDVVANGSINATDISVVKSRAGTSLP